MMQIGSTVLGACATIMRVSRVGGVSRAPLSPWPSVRALAPVRPPHYPALPAGGIILQQVLTVTSQICPLAGGDSPGPSLSICIFPGCEVECMCLHCIACVCKTGGNIPGFLDSEARGTLPQPGIDYILGVKGSEQARGQESCLCKLFVWGSGDHSALTTKATLGGCL